MKRILMCLLTLTILLCSCNSQDIPQTNVDLPPATEPVETPAAPSTESNGPGQEIVPAPEVNTQQPDAMLPTLGEPAREQITYTVERDTLQQEIRAENGILLASVRYQLPLLQARGADGEIITEGTTPERARALEVTAAFNENFEPWRQEDVTLRQTVTEDYTYRPDMFAMGMYYADELDFSVWQTEKLISIRADSYSYYGGAHPNSMLLGWNFALETGTYLNPLTLGEDEQAFRTLVAEELILQADERAVRMGTEAAYLYWGDYRSILQNWNDYPVTFDTAGMTVRFSAYELGSYASGAHEFTISYAFLKPYLGAYGCEMLGLTAGET